MAAKFDASRSAAPAATTGRFHATPTPTVAAAGISAAATITPTSDTGSAVARPSAPAAPAASPTASESAPGEMRWLICVTVVTSRVAGTNAAACSSQPTVAAPRTATSRLPTCARTPVHTISRSARTTPTAVVSAEPTCGAMTIDPTTSAGESSRRPATATSADSSVIE